MANKNTHQFKDKEPDNMKGVCKIVERNRSDKPHSDKGFTNTMTCPYVVDVAKRERLESIMDKSQVGVIIQTPEGLVLLKK